MRGLRVDRTMYWLSGADSLALTCKFFGHEHLLVFIGLCWWWGLSEFMVGAFWGWLVWIIGMQLMPSVGQLHACPLLPRADSWHDSRRKRPLVSRHACIDDFGSCSEMSIIFSTESRKRC